MTVTLRSQSNARATTKGSTLTHNELDNNFIHFLDTGIDIVGDDSTGATIKPGDDIKFAGSGTVATAVSGQTLTITGSGISASSTATLTNKTFDVEGTGNSISNIDVADLKSGVLDTDISSVSGSDDTLASAKAIKTYADTKATLSGNTDNTIATVTGAHALQGEANLTFDGSTLTVAGSGDISGNLTVDGSIVADTLSTTSNANMTLSPAGTGDVILNAGGITVTADGATNGQFSVVSTGTGGLVFENRAGRQEYPTSVFTLRNQPSGNAEIALGQYMQGAASGTSSDTSANIQYFAIYFDPNNNVFSRRAGSHAGDQNIYFGYNFTDNENYLLGDGGDSFHIRQFGDGSNSYGAGQIVIEGGYAEINNAGQSGGTNTSYLEIKERSGDPTAESGSAQFYVKSGEMFVQDGGGNATQLSPHNEAGEWHYFSRNEKTGKEVKVNMEKMIRKLEDITGETFFETFVPGNSH